MKQFRQRGLEFIVLTNTFFQEKGIFFVEFVDKFRSVIPVKKRYSTHTSAVWTSTRKLCNKRKKISSINSLGHFGNVGNELSHKGRS